MTSREPTVPPDTAPPGMLTYDVTMQIGAARYRDVLDALAAAGLPGEFIQTGGMNAALLVHLDGGQVLLITDTDDALPWDRARPGRLGRRPLPRRSPRPGT